MNWLRRLFGMKPRTVESPGALVPRPERMRLVPLDETARVRGQTVEAERRRRHRLEEADDSDSTLANALILGALMSDQSPAALPVSEPDSSGSGFAGFDGGASGGGGASGSWDGGAPDAPSADSGSSDFGDVSSGSSSFDSGSSYDSGGSFDSGGGSDFSP